MDNFEKMLHEMFDDIWDCEIDHPLFQDTVGDLMKDVIEAHKRAQFMINDDCISRKMAVGRLIGRVNDEHID